MIATHNRPRLLSGRSLKSVADQTRPPDLLIVVDDSDPEVRRHNREAVEGFGVPGTSVTYMENDRTPGASGAWNTALAHLQAAAPSAFVAILDDDDSWEPEYLRVCEKTSLELDLDMTASGIVYHKSEPPEEKLLDPPGQLAAWDLLIRNTNIQGSNMFVRLRKLLEAGGFDEALASTTDRDICIRLADLKTVKYGASGGHLVRHYAENDRPRLSKPGSPVKRAGLYHFFRKYRNRMSEVEKSAFIRRCRELFGYDPSEEVPEPPDAASSGGTEAAPRFVAAEPVHGGAAESLDLVVGAITSPDVTLAANLMGSLSRRIGGRGDATLKVVLLENGGHEAAGREALREAVDQAVAQGLDVTLITFERQAADAASGTFLATKRQLEGRKSIALSRTMLQHYLFLEAAPRAEAVTWILDDDVALEGLGYGPDGVVGAHKVDYVSGIRQLKTAGIDVVLCQDTGDPPLPALSCVRTQMVDIYHNLSHIASLRPDDPYPNLRGENRISRLDRRDYYYDLSSIETSHLELPFWYEAGGDLSVGQAFGEMAARLPDIMRGIQVFRPLTRVEAGGDASSLTPSVARGPATLVFDVLALRDFPNAASAAGGTDSRRSDMVWCLLNSFAGGRRIMRAQLPVRQVREKASSSRPVFDILLQDIRGYALYSTLQDAFTKRAHLRLREGKEPHGRDFLRFDEREVGDMVDSYREYVRRRALAFELSFIRIIGLLSALRPLCQPDPATEPVPWWLKSPEHAASAIKLQKFVESVSSVYTDKRLDGFRQQVSDIDTDAVEHFFKNLPATVDRHRANTPLPAEALRQRADAHVRSEFATGPLTCLGMGEEGTVLTDGRRVYKHFHHWNFRGRERKAAFLRSLAGRLSGYKTLPALLEVRQSGESVVAVYPYEAGTRYGGGHLDGLLTLLRECRQAGIACRNIHPDNLLVTPSGLKLVDYGADIVPFSGPEFEQMCRRVLLTYRFAFRSDLKSLMTRALNDAALPELAGLEQFKNALDPRAPDTIFYRPVVRMIADRRPRSALDYGCGGGKMAEMLSREGIKVTGYDPDPACIEKCRKHGGRASYGGSELRARLLAGSSRFDAVVCSRVLCTIPGRQEFEAVLRDLRRLASGSGEVFVAVCNPFYLTTTSTELAEKHLPEDPRYEDTFPYSKTVAVSGGRRMEVHRSYDAYRRAFAKAGLFVLEARESDGTDTLSVLPASEHLVFRLSPAPSDGLRVSLLIKTCLMEWQTIERLVRHQVGQLEGPRGFVERIVVVDPSEGPFPRQYDRPDAKAHRAAMERLLEDGVVDRVVYAPTDPKIIRSTYRRWFGAESVNTHSDNGQQLFATLFGFDSCSGDYVLQLDCDLLISRTDRRHDYLSEMRSVMHRDPCALFVSLDICRTEPVPYTSKGPGGDWRVEVRGCLYDRRRLQSILPVPNELRNGLFAHAWHRAFDRLIASSGYHSYRGGNPGTSFIHVPNNRKTGAGGWLDIVGAVERGHAPEAQFGSVDLAGSDNDWAGPKRSEPFVFVVCGRNAAHARFKRCLHSLAVQRGVKWGAVVVDDASTNGLGDYAEMLLADYADRVTLIRNERRRGTLYNTWRAVTQVCADPETVIVTVDADDALIGGRVLERVQAEYDGGADATVGSMLRLDKEAPHTANFDSPRRWDSNVWQHLRTFKKYLFDAINVEDFKIDGEWIDRATDWAFMVPIIEMAASPRLIPDRLYLYEPAVPKDKDGRRRRDRIIGRILSKNPYAKLKRDQISCEPE